MTSFWALINDHWWLTPGVLVAVGLVAFIYLWRAQRELSADLAETAEALAAGQIDGESNGVAFVRLHLVQPGQVDVPTIGERWILDRPMKDVLLSYVEERTSGFRFVAGSLATGLALLITFVLIAHVLSENVPAAIKATQGGAETSSELELSKAVQLLGQKFFISAAGVGLSVAWAGFATRTRVGLREAAERHARALGALFCTPEVFHMNVQHAQLAELRAFHDAVAPTLDAMSSRGQTLETHLVDVKTQLAKLQSIEVSVKDIGAEVTENVRRMLTDDLGNQIKQMLDRGLDRVDELAERVRADFVTGIQTALEKQLPEVLQSLQAIQKSVDQQSAAPVEALLERVNQVVSGGFRGETAQMNEALRQLSSVLPALETNLRSALDTMTSQLAARAQEQSALSENVMSQMGTLLGRLEAQQRASDDAVAGLMKAATEGVAAMGQQLQASSASAVESVMHASRSEIGAIVEGLRNVAANHQQSYAAVAQQMGDIGGVLAASKASLSDAAAFLKDAAAQAGSALGEGRQTATAISGAAREFGDAARQLQQGVSQLVGAANAVREQTEAQVELMARTKQQFHELEQTWPRLFHTHIESIEKQSKSLYEGWSRLATEVKTLSANVGGEFAESVDSLAASVQALHQNGARRS